MNLLHSTIDKTSDNKLSPLTHWVTHHGALSVAKYKELVQKGNSKPLIFQGETPDTLFEAYIDPEKKLFEVDRFSQVRFAVYSISSNIMYNTISCRLSDILMKMQRK